MAQYLRESVDDGLVSAMTAAAAAPLEADGRRRSQRRRRHDASGAEGSGGRDISESEGESEGEGERSDFLEPGSAPEGNREGESEGDRDEEAEGRSDARESGHAHERRSAEVGSEEDSDTDSPSPPRRGAPRRIPKTARLVATVPPTGVNKATTAHTTSRRIKHKAPPQHMVTIMAHCIKCTFLYDITAETPEYCSKCGNQWGVPPTATPPTTGTAGTPTTSTTEPNAAAPAPTTWAGASQFRAPALTSIPHRRAPGLAPLDEKIIRHAREGKQHYTLADLLPLRAEDRTTTSSVALSETAILFDPQAGLFSSAMGSAATSAKTAATRRRTIAGFTEVSEAMLYSLIGVIYVDRPDICWQLYHLWLLGLDLARARGWQFALDYIEAVRAKFYDSAGGPKGRHYLLIDSSYDMGVRDADVLLDIRMDLHGSTGKENVSRTVSNRVDTTRADPGRADSVDGKQRQAKSAEVCRGFNNGTCSRKPAECRFQHRCSVCSSNAHAALNCTNPRRLAAAAPAPAVPVSAISRVG